jgi:hypothetical protein
MVLGLFMVSLHLHSLTQVLMGFFQDIRATLMDQSDHMIELLSLFVHIDGKVGFIGSQVHSLSVFISSFSLKLAGLVYI